ncbi:MAG: hypothetical protein IH849_04955 [Acidobacteria bacterium]|nr:hypothetical protein [Acidobacteriota bacterium]
MDVAYQRERKRLLGAVQRREAVHLAHDAGAEGDFVGFELDDLLREGAVSVLLAGLEPLDQNPMKRGVGKGAAG